MKTRIYSQWMEDVYIPVRVKQFTKAAKLSGHSGFKSYADSFDLSEPSVGVFVCAMHYTVGLLSFATTGF